MSECYSLNADRDAVCCGTLHKIHFQAEMNRNKNEWVGTLNSTRIRKELTRQNYSMFLWYKNYIFAIYNT